MRIYSDDAVPTTIAAAGADTVTLADATGWPSPAGGDDATLRSLADALNLRYTGRAGNVLSGVTRLDGSAIPALTVGSDARHLLADEDMELIRRTRQYLFASGSYYTSPGAVTTSTPAEGRIGYVPLLVQQRTTFDRIAVVITGAGSAGAVIRLGVYKADESGRPAALLLDAGTVDGTLTGVQEITMSLPLEAGLYWLAAVVQGGAATRPTVRVGNPDHIPSVGITNFSTSNLVAGGYYGSVAGALPATADITSTASNSVTYSAKPYLRAA